MKLKFFQFSTEFVFKSCIGNLIFLYKKEKIVQNQLVRKIFGLLVKNVKRGVVEINRPMFCMFFCHI